MKKLKISKETLKEVIKVKVKNHNIIDTDGFVVTLRWNDAIKGILLTCIFDTKRVKDNDRHLANISNVMAQNEFIDIRNEEEFNVKNFQSNLYDAIYRCILCAEYEIGYDSDMVNMINEAYNELNKVKDDNNEELGNKIIDWQLVDEYIEDNYTFQVLGWCYEVLDSFSIDGD